MPEYNPINERIKKQYEEALLHGLYREKQTVNAVWRSLNLFEKFTGMKDFTTFNTVQAKGFKSWIAKQENKHGEPLSLSTVRSTLANISEFYRWLAIHPHFVRKIDGRAIVYLRLSNNDQRASRATRELPVPTIEDVHKALEVMPGNTDIEKRDRAIIAFTALTGVRDAALISLKMKDIDLAGKEVWQDPKHVKTKNRKGISSYFITIDPLWEEIVIEWICHARDNLDFKDNDPFIPKQAVKNNPETMAFESIGLSHEHWANASPVRDVFKTAFVNINLPYYRPHSIRNMLVLWAMKNCNQYQVKAISQNLGHEHTMTTYNSYGTLNLHDQRKAIASIGEANAELHNVPIDDLLMELAKRTAR